MAVIRKRRARALVSGVVAAAVLAMSASLALAQSGDPKGADKPPAAEPGRDQKKIDEFAEASRVLGGPASNPECVWLGRRVVNLMWRDDLDTAFRHLDLYDRFGCPGGHIQAAFRCLIQQGQIEQKPSETLNSRVHACWINPVAQAPTPAPAAPAAATATPPTTTR